MKDNKDDDTVRYKNTLESYDNSLNNNNISDEKNIKINTKEENKNIIDKLYDCGDEISLDDDNFQINNYYLNDLNKNINKDENSNKKERYNLNMNMFKFTDNDDIMDMNNGKEIKNINKEEYTSSNNNIDKNNSSGSINKYENGNEINNNDEIDNDKIDKLNINEEINSNNNIYNEDNKKNNFSLNNKKQKNNHIDLNKYKLDVDDINNINNNYSVDEKEKTEEKDKLSNTKTKDSPKNFKREDVKKEIFNESIYKYEQNTNSNEIKQNLLNKDLNNIKIDEFDFFNTGTNNTNLIKKKETVDTKFQNKNEKEFNNKYMNEQEENINNKYESEKDENMHMNEEENLENKYINEEEEKLNNKYKNEEEIPKIIRPKRIINKLDSKNQKKRNIKENHNKSMEYPNYTIFENDFMNKKHKNNVISSEKDIMSNNNSLDNSAEEYIHNNEFTLSNINRKKIKKMKSTEIHEYKYIKDFNPDEDMIEEDNNNKKENNTKNTEDMELTYLTKLSKLKQDNNSLVSQNAQLKEEIEKLNSIINKQKKEVIDNKTLYNEINFEYDVLNKKYENLLKKKNENFDENKEKEMKNEIEQLKMTVNDLNNEMKNKDTKSKNEINQLKQMLENLKILHEQMKDQYDLLILKLNTVNQENFSLKRELYFYQNTTNNNNMNNNTNYNSNGNTNYNSNSNNKSKYNGNNNNNFENDYKNENTKYLRPKYNYNNIKIDIENDNKNYNYKKINKDKSGFNDNKDINNGSEEIIPTITNSHRKFIANINQNDSSSVSALLKNNINNVRDNEINKRENAQIRNNNYKNFESKPGGFRNIQKLRKEQNNVYENERNERVNYFNINEDHDYYNETNYNKNNNTINSNIQNRRRKIARTKSIDLPNNGNSKTNINYPENQNYEENYSNNKNRKKDNPIISFQSESNLQKEKQINEIQKTLAKLQKQRNIYLDEYDKLPEHPKKQKDLIDKRDLKQLIDELNMNINEYKRQERNLKKNYFEYI